MSNLNRIRTVPCTVGVLLAMLAIDPRLRAEPGQQQGTSAPAPTVARPLTLSTALQVPPPASAQSGATLELSMQQAEAMALETNLGLKASRLNVDIASQNIASARAAFLPVVGSRLQRNTSSQIPQSFTQGNSSVITSGGISTSASLQQSLPWLGGFYFVGWQGSRNTTTGFTTFNPQLGSALQLQYSQPLWRNLFTDANRFGVDSSIRLQQIADLTLQQQVISTRAAVDSAYLGLIAAIAGSKVAQENMDLAQQQLRDSQSRVAVGTAAQIDIIQAQAQVASNEEQVIVAVASIATAEDNLRSIMLDPTRPDYWDVHIQPTDVIDETQLTAGAIDVDAAVKNALANRLDLVAARRNLEITDQALQLDQNLTHPQLDLNLSYTAQGTGGTQFTYAQTGYPPAILSEAQRSFRSVLSDAFTNAYPQTQVSVVFSVPIGTSAAQATMARDRLSRQQQIVNIRNLELQVQTAVRQAARQVDTNIKRVEATKAAQQATFQQLDAEKRKFAVGLSDTFRVQSFEGQLAVARVIALNALIAYRQSLIDFQTVQKVLR